jgi:hypothetical protein
VSAAQVVPPLKSGEFRITLSTNRDAVQLAQVFTDMLQQVCVLAASFSWQCPAGP